MAQLKHCIILDVPVPEFDITVELLDIQQSVVKHATKLQGRCPHEKPDNSGIYIFTVFTEYMR